MRIDYVGDAEDTEGPKVTATVEGRSGPGNRYVGSATVRLSAQDVGVAGTARIEHRVDGGAWQTSQNTSGGDPFVVSVPLEGSGVYTVEYRATDREGNTSETGRTEVTVIPAASCTFNRSDEFDGTSIAPRWTLRTGPNHQITQTGGRLILPVLWELDGAENGPLSFAGQQVPDGDWSMTTRVTVNNVTEWQGAGLYLWQGNNNFVKFGYTVHSPDGTRNFELTSDNPPNGTREFSNHESGAGLRQHGVAAPVPAGQRDPRPVRQGRQRAARRVGDPLRLAARQHHPGARRRRRADRPVRGRPAERVRGTSRPRSTMSTSPRTRPTASVTSTRRPRRRRSTARRPRPRSSRRRRSRCRRRTPAPASRPSSTGWA